jgi:glycosyltransferase involved in cell wall biosynthesis
MKILYLNYLYDLKSSSVGAGVHFSEMIHALNEVGHHVKGFYLNRFTSIEESVQSRWRDFLKRKLWRYANQINAVLSNVRYFIKEWKIITEEKPRLLLIRYNIYNISPYIVAKIRGIPVISEVNAPMAYESRHFAKKVIHIPFLSEFIEKLALKLSDRIVVVSRQLKTFFIAQGLSEEKIDMVPNGVDVGKFNPSISGKRIRKLYGLNNQTILGFVGSFHYWHGIEYIERFIQMILSQRPNCGFLLVGDGPLKAEMEKRLKSGIYADKVHFSGYIQHKDIPEYIAAMDIVLAIYPKLELFYYSPLKLYEYMASGKAVVASRIGQIKDIITDGKNGFLFDPGNLNDLEDKVIRLLDNPSLIQVIGKNSRKTVENKYTWKQSALKVSSIMENIVTG